MSRNKKNRHFVKTHEFFLFLIDVLFLCAMALVTKGRFVTPENITDMLVAYVPVGVMSMGVLVVIISGEIDISFMAVASVAQYMAAQFMLHIGGNKIVIFVLAAAVGLLIGVINGLLVHFVKAPAIITTIATMNITYGLFIYVTQGKVLCNFPKWFNQKTMISTWAIPVSVLGFSILLTAALLKYTRIGRQIFDIGGNREAAKRIGINIRKVQIIIFGFVGAMAGLGAASQMFIVQSVSPTSLVGREMEVLAIVVLGGAALTGGKGSVVGNILSIILIAMLDNGLILLKISSYWHLVFMGLVILGSFCLTAIRNNNRPERSESLEVE